MITLVCTILFLFACAETEIPKSPQISLTSLQELGKKMFFDEDLSSPPGQSCASCHHPDFAFADPNLDLPVSQGAQKTRFGNRNDLTAMYAMYIPELHFDEKEGIYLGGLFWDGRANSLEEQAMGPPLNPLEMANKDALVITEKIKKSGYKELFLKEFGKNALDDPEKAFAYFASAVAAYERSDELNPFNSKYDYYLKGKVDLSEQEMRGLISFNSPDKGNCAACHPSSQEADGTPPLFTDFSYDNLGVPKNPANPFYYIDRSDNPDGPGYVDLGLGAVVGKSSENGKFRVPTLRNVAKTAPYMHNGAFQTLREAVVFYNTRDIGPWPLPEVNENINKEELGNLELSEQDIDDIVAFLETLNDGYEEN
jgi:cytochrome c peroxidase